MASGETGNDKIIRVKPKDRAKRVEEEMQILAQDLVVLEEGRGKLLGEEALVAGCKCRTQKMSAVFLGLSELIKNLSDQLNE